MAAVGVNQPAQTADEIIHFLIFTVACNVAKVAIIADAPFFGLPVISQLTDLVLNTVGGYIYRALALSTTFAIIDIQTELEKTAYIKAEGDLRKAHLSGNQEDLSAAKENFKKALVPLIRFDGSASP